MLLNTRKQQMLSVDSVVVVTRKQSRAIKRILADNRAALDADFAEFGTMDASCARAHRALRVVSFPSHEFSKVLFEKTHCLFTKNRALTPDLKPIARECCVAASTTSDIDVDGPSLVLSPRSRPHGPHGPHGSRDARGVYSSTVQSEGVEMRPLRRTSSLGVTPNSLNEVASAVKASFSEGPSTPAVEHVTVTPQEHKKRSVEEMTLVDYLFCVGGGVCVRA